MHRIRTFLAAAVLVVGLAGAASADQYDGSRYRGDGGSYETWDRGGYGDRGRDYGRHDGRSYGRFTPVERLRLRQARLHLRLVERRALRDGVVTRWERARIQQARQRVAWLTLRLSHNGRGW